MKVRVNDRSQFFQDLWHEFKHDIFDILNKKTESVIDIEQIKANPLLKAFEKPPMSIKQN